MRRNETWIFCKIALVNNSLIIHHVSIKYMQCKCTSNVLKIKWLVSKFDFHGCNVAQLGTNKSQLLRNAFEEKIYLIDHN